MPDKDDCFTEKPLKPVFSTDSIKEMMKTLLNFFYPRRCVLCRQSDLAMQSTDIDLCPACEQELPRIEHACYQCGIPLAHTLTQATDQVLCGQCLQKTPLYDRVISLLHYQPPVTWLVQQMKFHNKPSHAKLLSTLLLRRIQEDQLTLPEAIIPVPLHHKRQFQRGFNQSDEIARTLSKSLNCKLDRKLLKRMQNNRHQSGLNAKQRRQNVRGVFQLANNKPAYRHVAVVDDVMSTGSTVNEIARVLKRAGITRVDVWVVARAEAHR